MLYLNEKVRECTVTGLKDTTLFSLSKKGFERFRAGLPALAKNIECECFGLGLNVSWLYCDLRCNSRGAATRAAAYHR